MSHYSYLIIGGGMAADAAFRGIREVDQNDSIGLIGADPHPPCNRPPLSKGLWKGAPLEEIWRRTEGQNVELHLGREARSLDPQNKRVADDRGAVYSFDKLLLAAALATNGREVVMIFPEEGIGARLFPHDLAGFLNNYYREKGIAVLSEESVAGLERRGDQLVLKSRNARTSSRREVEVEAVVAGIGIQPNVELAQAAGLKVGNGIVVDELLRTSHPDIYAAGDVASFHNPALGGQEKPTRALRQWPTGRSRTARA